MTEAEAVVRPVPAPAPGGQATLAQRAYRLVRERILKGVYPPGAALSRRRLADEFGMSLLPVAEALQRLANDGLLESRPRVGTRVRTPGRDEIRDRYMLREALESQSARLFSMRANPREKAEILRLAKRLDDLYAGWAGKETDAEYRLSVRIFHVKFHLRVAEIGGSPLLRKAIEREQDLLFSWLSDTAAQVHPLPPRYHTELAEALCSGDLLLADRAIRAHISYALDELLKLSVLPNGARWRLGPRKAVR